MEGINHGFRLRRNLKLCLAGRKSAHHWTIQQSSQFTQQICNTSNSHHHAAFWITFNWSKKSRRTTRAATQLIDKRWQICQRGLHNNIPPTWRRRNGAQEEHFLIEIVASASPPRVAGCKRSVAIVTWEKTTNPCNKEQAGGGGECLQPTLDATDNLVFACCHRFPNKGLLDQGNQKWKLHTVARNYGQGHQWAFPGVSWDSKRTHEKTASKCKIHKAEANAGWANRGCWTYLSNLQAKDLNQSCQCTRDGILQPDRATTHTIQPRKHIVHGIFWCQDKLHQCQANVEPSEQPNDPSLSKTVGTHKSRSKRQSQTCTSWTMKHQKHSRRR